MKKQTFTTTDFNGNTRNLHIGSNDNGIFVVLNNDNGTSFSLSNHTACGTYNSSAIARDELKEAFQNCKTRMELLRHVKRILPLGDWV